MTAASPDLVREQSKWDELFSDEERQIALSRLRDCGMDV